NFPNNSKNKTTQNDADTVEEKKGNSHSAIKQQVDANTIKEQNSKSSTNRVTFIEPAETDKPEPEEAKLQENTSTQPSLLRERALKVLSRETKENECVEYDVKRKLSRALTEKRGVGNGTLYPTPRPAHELSDNDLSGLSLDGPLSSTKNCTPATHMKAHYPAPDEQSPNNVTTQMDGVDRKKLDSNGNDRPRGYRFDRITLQPTLEHTQPIAVENQSTFQTSDISGPKPSKKPRARIAKDQNNPLPNVILINTNGEEELLVKPTGHGTSAEVEPLAFSTQEINGFRIPQSPSLDPKRTGYVTGQDVVAYWSRLGVTEPEKALKQLGFQEEEQIDLKKLMNLLENRVTSSIPRDNPVCTAALLTLLNERCLVEQNNGNQHEKVAEFSEAHSAEHNGLADQFKQEFIECRAELKHVSDERDRLKFEVDVEKQKNSELLKNFVNSQSQLAVVSEMLDAKQEEVSFLKTAHHAVVKGRTRTNTLIQKSWATVLVYKSSPRIVNSSPKIFLISLQTEYEEIKQQLEEAIKLANTSSPEDSRLPLLMEALQEDADDRQLLQTIHGELLTEQQHLRQTLLQTQSQLEELKVIREERNSNIKDLQRLNQSLVEKVDSLGRTMNEKNKAVLLSYQLINELQHNAQLQNRIAELESNHEKRLYEIRVPEEEASHPELSWNASLTNPAESIQKLAYRLEIALKERAALLEYQLELEKTLKIQAEQIRMFETNMGHLDLGRPRIPAELSTIQPPVARKRTTSLVHPEVSKPSLISIEK
ncbi:hypothetical protein P879_03019, partial [Paragonimus westermani]